MQVKCLKLPTHFSCCADLTTVAFVPSVFLVPFLPPGETNVLSHWGGHCSTGLLYRHTQRHQVIGGMSWCPSNDKRVTALQLGRVHFSKASRHMKPCRKQPVRMEQCYSTSLHPGFRRSCSAEIQWACSKGYHKGVERLCSCSDTCAKSQEQKEMEIISCRVEVVTSSQRLSSSQPTSFCTFTFLILSPSN